MTSPPFVYGPVPSRRLGLSLGLNIIPRKTCTLDCVYCQLGRTTRKTLKRESFFPVSDILAEVRSAVRNSTLATRRSQLSYLTFSGEGEPTLNKDIGTLIRRLKREFRTPVAVITNSTLMTDPKVRRDLLGADLVVPSLDAADQHTFMKVDRCHRDLKVADIIAALKTFRRAYRGRMWLEIMLVKGVNDSVEHVVSLRRAAWEIRPDRVQLNTVVRPPAEEFALPMEHDDLARIQMLFGPGTDIAELPPTAIRRPPFAVRRAAADLQSSIVAFVSGRPGTVADLGRSLAVSRTRFVPLLRRMVRNGRVRRVRFGRRVYYEPPRP
jgi:wyosine [tRNA(Phe)-imidazoG37] synthetase (radical SAM superfamily)